jgi:hypothetical protein
MRIARLGVVALALVALSAGVSACGGDDSDEAAPPAAETTTPATTEETTTEETTTEETTADETTSEETGTTDGVTAPGTVLAIGETAQVTIKPLTAASDSTKTYRVDATVVKIEKGSIDDFANINLDEAQKASTPYYVTVRVSNPGPEDVPVADSDPDVRFNGIDDRGQRQGIVIFFGTFDRCENTEAPAPFTGGKSYDSCHVYLVPGGGSITEATWAGSDEYILEPVVWK